MGRTVQKSKGPKVPRGRTIATALAVCWTATAHGQIDNDDRWQPDLIIRANQQVIWQSPQSVPALPGPEILDEIIVEPGLLELVRQLEDPSFAAREQANRKLLESQPDKMQLYALLAGKHGELSAEQRYRLLSALKESLVRTPRGALGISMQQLPINFGNPMGRGLIEIRVTDLIPGLPAEQVLKVGDRITQVDHQALTSQQDLLMRVQSKKPGDTVALSIRRPKLDDDGRPLVDANNEPITETMDVQLELGSAELLRDFNQARFGNQAFFDQSPVERMRQAEAEAALRELAPSPRPIALDAGSKLSSPSGADDFYAEVDEDPVIVGLLMQRQIMSKGTLTAEQIMMVRDQWNKTLEDLYARAQNRNLSPQQKAHVQEVIERAIELMNMPIGPDKNRAIGD